MLDDQSMPLNHIRFGIRAMTPGDINYVASTWRTNFRRASTFASLMTDEVYHQNHRELINRTLEWTPCYVAYDIDYPELQLGFLAGGIFSGYPVIHYIYVKRPFRGFGIAQALLEHLGWKPGIPMVGTHWTRETAHLYSTKNNILYNPYLLYQEFRDVNIQALPAEQDRIYTVKSNATDETPSRSPAKKSSRSASRRPPEVVYAGRIGEAQNNEAPG